MGIRQPLLMLIRTCLLCLPDAIIRSQSHVLNDELHTANQHERSPRATSSRATSRDLTGNSDTGAASFTPSVNASHLCPKLRIVLLNAVSFHFEVLAGLLHVLQPYEKHIDVILGPHIRGQNYDGAWDLLKWSGARFLHSKMKLVSAFRGKHMRDVGSNGGGHVYDLAILVSADYELATAIHVLERLRPKLTLALVHNADWVQLSTLLSLGRPAVEAHTKQGLHDTRSTSISGIAGDLELFTLAPHVAASLTRALQIITVSSIPTLTTNTTPHTQSLATAKLAFPTTKLTLWILATLPFQPSPDCSTKNSPKTQIQNPVLGACLHGFSIQGKFSNLRRNYSSLWAGMTTSLQNLSSPPLSNIFRLNILGKGPDRLALPPALASLVTLHRRLPFPQFYATIGSTIALLPSLAGGRYYTDKFSSTIITSLSTGTPVLAVPAFAETYTMLSSGGAVLLQGQEEGVVDAMMRLMQAGEQEVVDARSALKLVQQQLNLAAFAALDVRIARLCRAHAGL